MNNPCIPVYSVLDAADEDESFSQFSPFWFTDGKGDNWPTADSGLWKNKHLLSAVSFILEMVRNNESSYND